MPPYGAASSEHVPVYRLRMDHGQAGSYPVETRVGSRASDFEAEYTWVWEIRDEGSGAA